MKKHFKFTPVALAVAALIASPVAFADNGDDHLLTAKADLELNVDVDVTTSRSNVDVDIQKDVNYEENVNINVDSYIEPDAYARAIINDTQSNKLNAGFNTLHDNDASASGDALSNAAGNIGLNITAGDNNQQDNSAAMAVADAEMTFGAADAQAHSSQDGELNYTLNLGVSNDASLRDNALQNASGNIGVNISAGNNNQQKNNLSVAVSTGGVGLAMVTTDQESDRNLTVNHGKVVTLNASGSYEGSVNLSGSYSGQSDQIGNVYPDVWANTPNDNPTTAHPTDDPFVAHIDLDTNTQGGSDLNGDGGALAFNEAGDITLSGYTSGSYRHSWDVFVPTSDTASLSGNALSGASGNIGVNVASGTGNQQVNSLAMSVSTGTGMGGGMNGGGTMEP